MEWVSRLNRLLNLWVIPSHLWQKPNTLQKVLPRSVADVPINVWHCGCFASSSVQFIDGVWVCSLCRPLLVQAFHLVLFTWGSWGIAWTLGYLTVRRTPDWLGTKANSKLVHLLVVLLGKWGCLISCMALYESQWPWLLHSCNACEPQAGCPCSLPPRYPEHSEKYNKTDRVTRSGWLFTGHMYRFISITDSEGGFSSLPISLNVCMTSVCSLHSYLL